MINSKSSEFWNFLEFSLHRPQQVAVVKTEATIQNNHQSSYSQILKAKIVFVQRTSSRNVSIIRKYVKENFK